jgi:hypothetical protein
MSFLFGPFTVAILLDTSAYLNRKYGRTPTILISIRGSNDTSSHSVPFQTASSFWFPLYVEIVPTITPLVGQAERKHDDGHDIVMGQYSIQVVSTCDKKGIATMSVMQNTNHEKRLVWDLIDGH